MIYADHAATTMLSPKAKEAMLPWLSEEYGNPSTLYSFGRKPRQAISAARASIATAIGAHPDEVFFTSGGTEADNWALFGTALRYMNKRKRIITSCIEHHAILHTCEFLEKQGFDIVYLPVNNKGLVSEDVLLNAIDSDTVLVSIMHANNEIGTIEPIERLCSIAHRGGALFHTDAVQTMGHIDVDVSSLGIDMLSASAHKFNGPKGIGFLYVKNGVTLETLLHGGGQERGMRSGTENVASIVGMATALNERISVLSEEANYLSSLRAELLSHLHAANLDFLENGGAKRIPGSISLSFRGIDGEMLLHRLDLMGIAIATGSACNSKENVLSHVISAIDVPDVYARGTVRITLGSDNDSAQIKRISDAIVKVVGGKG